MSVQAVNSVNNIQPKPVQSPIESQKPEQKEGISNGTKLLLGSLAALAIGGGIYLATRGRSSSGSQVGTNSSSSINEVKEYTVQAFKEAGNKFEKGIAKLANGENYTGTIIHKNEYGNKVVIEYKSGIIQKSTEFYQNEPIMNKVYSYDKAGNLSKITLDNKEIYTSAISGNIKTVKTKNANFKFDKNIGKLITLEKSGKGTKDFFYTKEGVLKYISHWFVEPGTTGIREITKFAQDGKTKLFTLRSSREAKFFDKDGKVIDEIQIDLIRGGKNYTYKDLHYNEDVIDGKKDYKLLNPNGSIKAWLTKVDRPNYGSNDLRLTSYGNKYTINIDTDEIHDNKGVLIRNRELSEQILLLKNQILEEINTKHQKAMELKEVLQNAVYDTSKFDHILIQ